MKKNSQPILSICIPTWNRWYALQYTLKSIMNQNGFKSGDVEIVISDNASTDETEHEVGKLCKKYNNIRYFRNEKNIGPNPNINKVLLLGKGEYLWLLGSDSFINEDGIADTLNVIRLFKPDIIYYNDEHDHKIFFDKKIPRFNDDYKMYKFYKQFDFFSFLGDMYSYNKNNFRYAEKLLTFVSVRCLSKEFYKTNKAKALQGIKKSLNNHSYPHSILSTYSECTNCIIAFTKPHITRNLTNKTRYVVSLKIVKDLIYFYSILQKKWHVLSLKYFRIIVMKSVTHWVYRCIYGNIYSFVVEVLKKIGIYEMLSKLWMKYVLKRDK